MSTANCGDLWWLCGPAFDLTSPGFWIGSAVQTTVLLWIGYRWGRSDGEKKR